MFRSARLKLTGWYLLIIMLISAAFSVVIYEALTAELGRIERAQQFRIEREYLDPNLPVPIRPPFLDPEIVNETKTRLQIILVTINVIILGTSAVAGYFLAGRTLKPIQVMVADQNRFVTDASHELRTPLTALKTEIEVNLRDKRLNITEAKQVLISNLDEVNKLQTLADGLITLAKYRPGDLVFPLTPQPLVEITREAVKKVTPLLKPKQMTISTQVEPLTIMGNRGALVEMLVIFLDNAIKYSPAKTPVTITATRIDGKVILKITDQGIGIEPKDLPHLFDRFYRADTSRSKEQVAGFGLGLAIASEIIDRHRGSVKVQSEPKLGTTFSIELPLSKLS